MRRRCQKRAGGPIKKRGSREERRSRTFQQKWTRYTNVFGWRPART